MGHINIEIKAKTADQDYIRKILKSQNADFKGVDHQIDTYFKVSSGRLKLREGNIENYLIYYERDNKSGPKQSNVNLYKCEQESSLKDILGKSLGVLAIVDKKREIYWIDNVKNSEFLSTPKTMGFSGVKFHLDNVKNLGTFVEIEAIDYKGNIGKEKLLNQCNYYMDLFKISKKDLISVSYSDLLSKKSWIFRILGNAFMPNTK